MRRVKMRNEDINIHLICRAKKKDDRKWILGIPAYKYINDKRKWYMYPMEVEIDAETICRTVGKVYMDSEIAFEKDIFESQVSGDLMILKYGTYQAFCPADRTYMESVGFYAECGELHNMPIGNLEEYALKVGNMFDNPEIMALGKEREYGK